MQAGCDVEKSHTRPLGQAASQQQPSSSAGAAHASSSEPAPTSRTPIERSRGGRSPRAKHAGQLRRSRTAARLVQEHVDCEQPSSHSDLADEDEHVERAGLGHAHHEREVLDVQAPAPASSSLGDQARHPQIAPHWFSSKPMASSALDEQQHQHGGRRDDRTHHDRALVLASPPRATRATRPTAWPVRAVNLLLRSKTAPVHSM